MPIGGTECGFMGITDGGSIGHTLGRRLATQAAEFMRISSQSGLITRKIWRQTVNLVTLDMSRLWPIRRNNKHLRGIESQFVEKYINSTYYLHQNYVLNTDPAQAGSESPTATFCGRGCL